MVAVRQIVYLSNPTDVMTLMVFTTGSKVNFVASCVVWLVQLPLRSWKTIDKQQFSWQSTDLYLHSNQEEKSKMKESPCWRRMSSYYGGIITISSLPHTVKSKTDGTNPLTLSEWPKIWMLCLNGVPWLILILYSPFTSSSYSFESSHPTQVKLVTGHGVLSDSNQLKKLSNTWFYPYSKA